MRRTAEECRCSGVNGFMHTFRLSGLRVLGSVLILLVLLSSPAHAEPGVSHGHSYTHADHDHDLCREKVDARQRKFSELLPPINEHDLPPQESSGVLLPLNTLPILHSRPGASQKIFLDFDGHVHSGIWGSNITTPPYSTDGDTSTFSEQERQNIISIWEKVAEDFAPFDVDVTTEDPNDFSSNAGIRVCIGGSASDWYGSGAGGVAYIGSWRWNSDTPAYVFENNLGNGNPKYTAEAVSHEVGHTIGLYHQSSYDGDGNIIESYYRGSGSGETGWAPIMGVGYYKNLTVFYDGSQTNGYQDDLATFLGGSYGINRRPDDHGSTDNTATPLVVSNGTDVSGSGVIEQVSDVDVFSFTTGAGTITLSVDVYDNGPNLDAKIELYDDSGNFVASDDGASVLDASVSATATERTYYLRVKSNGAYGRIGQYTVSGTIVEPAGSGGDSTAPTATLVVGGTTLRSETSAHTLQVRYQDNVAIASSSLGNSDVRVSGPNGYNQMAVLSGVDQSGDGSPRTGTYVVTGPNNSFNHLANGTYTILLENAQVLDTSNNAVSGGTLGSFSVSVSEPENFYTLSGRVTYAGSPLADVTIEAGALGTTTTDSSGNFSFTNVAENTSYSMTPSLNGYDFNPVSVSGTLTANTSRDFVATQKTYTISGTVRFFNNPLSGVNIDGGSLGTRTTDVNGRYSFENVPFETSYRLTASKNTYAFSPTELIGVTGTGNSGRKDFAADCAEDYELQNGVCTVAVSAPAAPSSVVASNGSSRSLVLVAWSRSANARSYQLYRSSTQNGEGEQIATIVGDEKYEDASARLEKRYYYFVRALNAGGASAFSERDEGWRSGDSFSMDSDDDGITDGQELLDGTDPFDRGSGLAVLPQEVCSETNGYLGMLNVMEHVNMSSSDLRLSTKLTDVNGAKTDLMSYALGAGKQYDVLAHDMKGRDPDTLGRACTTHDGAPGDVDGRMVYYRIRPGSNPPEIEFAFAMPFLMERRGAQFVTFNNFGPSLDPADADNLTANWVLVGNPNEYDLLGELIAYDMEGELLATVELAVPPGGRREFGAHEFGPNLVGIIEWRPYDKNAYSQLRVVRYYYDNPFGINSFDTAFQLEAQRGSGSELSMPLDTSSGSAIIEIGNTLAEAVIVDVSIYDEFGNTALIEAIPLAAKASRHIIADAFLAGAKGIAVVKSRTPESIFAVAMQYGRTPTGGIQYIYGILGGQAIGALQRSSYNTFLGQACDLLLVNPGAQNVEATIGMLAPDGVSALEGMIKTVPAHGLLTYDLCSNDRPNTYGVVTVQTDSPSLYGAVLRIGEGNRYRLPTPLRR